MIAGLSHLKFLGVGYNHINHIEVDAFQSVPRLVTLLLQHNHIRHLESGLFKPLTALRHLDLASNYLYVLQADVFHGLSSVGDVKVDNNELVEIEYQVFNATPRLRSFSARANHLRVADLRILDSAMRLRSLHLSKNLISKVIPVEMKEDDAGFSPLYGLSVLSLADNLLRAINESVLNGLRRSGGLLRVGGNPWYCDCKLHWLVMVVRGQSRHQVDKHSSVVCSSPPYLTNRQVSIPRSIRYSV